MGVNPTIGVVLDGGGGRSLCVCVLCMHACMHVLGMCSCNHNLWILVCMYVCICMMSSEDGSLLDILALVSGTSKSRKTTLQLSL
jgi:hypothetical protein